MRDLRGKRALVTAGGQGIGLAIAKELLSQGCNVTVSYRSSRAGAESFVAEAIAAGRCACAVQADLTVEDGVNRVVSEAVDCLGGLDVLINNAGGLVERRLIDAVDPDFLQRVMDINVKSMVMVTRAAVPHLAAAGAASIVNLSSLAGRKGGHPGSLVYSMSKGAVLTWTRALAAELGPKGIRVNAVAPGFMLGSSFHATHTTDDSARKPTHPRMCCRDAHRQRSGHGRA